jgi:hypothetical protein
MQEVQVVIGLKCEFGPPISPQPELAAWRSGNLGIARRRQIGLEIWNHVSGVPTWVQLAEVIQEDPRDHEFEAPAGFVQIVEPLGTFLQTAGNKNKQDHAWGAEPRPFGCRHASLFQPFEPIPL